LPIAEAEHFALGPAALSILGYDPHHPAVAVITLWNGVNNILDEAADASDTATIKRSTIQRWENEGGEIQSGSDAD
jgi:hypothetical protein